MSKYKSRRRVLGMERLSDRIALSVNPIGSLGAEVAGEGETASVTQQGQTVTVIGSDNDDTIQIELGEAVHKLVVNGDSTEYNAADVNEIIVQGDGGRDTVSIQGSDQSENAEFKDGTFELKSSSHLVRVSLAEDVTVTAGGGASRAVLFDTDGDDSLELRAEAATFVDKDGSKLTLNGFDRVMAFADNGGTDEAKFYDTTADDTFIGKEAFSFMVGDDFWNYARGFDHVDVFQEEGGNDTAWLFGADGDDQLLATPAAVTLTLSSGSTLGANGFATTRIHAGGGNNSATITGEVDAQDRFIWDANSAEMRTTRSESVTTVIAKSFQTIVAHGGEESDAANLRGSDEADSLIALPEVVQLTTPTASVIAHNFGLVVSDGGAGEDTAHLEDSRFNDSYFGKPNFAYLTGPGYLNLVTQFDIIDVAATNGGYDYSLTQFGATIYTVSGGQASLPFIELEGGGREQVGQFELTSSPGVAINAFTRDDLESNRVIYVHQNDDPIDVAIEFKVNDALQVMTTGNVAFSVNKDGNGRTFAVTTDSFTGPITDVTQPLVSDFFVLQTTQHWIYGTSRNERIFGFSRARSIGPGNGDLRTEADQELYNFLTRENQNGQINMPAEFIAAVELRDQTPVANYDLVDGEIVKVGDAVLNPPRIDF